MSKAPLLAIAALLVGLALLSPQVAQALPPNEVEIVFLDQNGEEVGYFFRSCNGDRIVEGTMTNVRMAYSEPCATHVPELTCTYQGVERHCWEVPFWDVCNRYFIFSMCSSS